MSPFVMPCIRPPKMIAGARQAKNRNSVEPRHFAVEPVLEVLNVVHRATPHVGDEAAEELPGVAQPLADRLVVSDGGLAAHP